MNKNMSITRLGKAARAAYYAERREHVNEWDSVSEAVIAEYLKQVDIDLVIDVIEMHIHGKIDAEECKQRVLGTFKMHAKVPSGF